MDPLCQMYQDAANGQRWDELAAIHEKMVRLGYAFRDSTCYPPGTLPGVVPYSTYVSPWKPGPVSVGGWETGAVGTPGSCMYTFMMEAKAAGLAYQAALNAWGSLPEGQCTYTPLTTPAIEIPATEPAQEIQTIPTTPSPETPAAAVPTTTPTVIPESVTPAQETVPTTTPTVIPESVTPVSTAPASFFGFVTNEMAANIIVFIAVIIAAILLASGGGKS